MIYGPGEIVRFGHAIIDLCTFGVCRQDDRRSAPRICRVEGAVGIRAAAELAGLQARAFDLPPEQSQHSVKGDVGVEVREQDMPLAPVARACHTFSLSRSPSLVRRRPGRVHNPRPVSIQNKSPHIDSTHSGNGRFTTVPNEEELEVEESRSSPEELPLGRTSQTSTTTNQMEYCFTSRSDKAIYLIRHTANRSTVAAAEPIVEVHSLTEWIWSWRDCGRLCNAWWEVGHVDEASLSSQGFMIER